MVSWQKLMSRLPGEFVLKKSNIIFIELLPFANSGIENF